MAERHAVIISSRISSHSLCPHTASLSTPTPVPIPSLRCLSAEDCQAWRGEHVSRREWKRQLTCHTPLQRLPWFTGELVRLLAPFDRALLIIDLIVFDVPAELEALRRAAGETRTIREAPGHVVEGDPEGFRRLLEVVLSDWVDFRVVFSPPATPFAPTTTSSPPSSPCRPPDLAARPVEACTRPYPPHHACTECPAWCFVPHPR